MQIKFIVTKFQKKNHINEEKYGSKSNCWWKQPKKLAGEVEYMIFSEEKNSGHVKEEKYGSKFNR